MTLGPDVPVARIEIVEVNVVPVGQDDISGADMVSSHTIEDRVSARSIIPQHAADRCPVSAGWIRSKHQIVLAQSIVDLTQCDARLNTHGLGVRVDREDLIHVAGEVQHQGVPYSLPSQAAAPAARQDRNIVPGGDLNRRSNLFTIARESHADRYHLVDTGVCAVEQTRHAVEVYFGNCGTQLLDEFLRGFRGLRADHNAVYRIIDLLGGKG